MSIVRTSVVALIFAVQLCRMAAEMCRSYRWLLQNYLWRCVCIGVAFCIALAVAIWVDVHTLNDLSGQSGPWG